MTSDSLKFLEFFTGVLVAAKNHYDSSSILGAAKCHYAGTKLCDISSEVIPSKDIQDCFSEDGGGRDYWVDVKLRTATYASDHAYRLLHSEMEEYKLIQSNFKGDYTCKNN